MGRVEQIQKMLEAEPEDVFLHYSLAMELAKAGEMEAALASFGRVIELDPNYSAAYFHQGKMLLEAKRYEEARGVLEQGKEVAKAAGDSHTRDELVGLLELIP